MAAAALRLLNALAAADEGFVGLDNAAARTERGEEVGAHRLAEALEHEPGRLLSDADLLGELEAGDALPRRDEQIHRIEPLMERDLGPLEDGAGADGKVRQAGVAAVEAALAGADPLRLIAGRADSPGRPALRLEIGAGALLIGEHLEQFEGADGALAHGLVREEIRAVGSIAALGTLNEGSRPSRVAQLLLRLRLRDALHETLPHQISVPVHLNDPSSSQGYPHDKKISTRKRFGSQVYNSHPKDWRLISAGIRFDRAGGQCECTGECGINHQGRCAALHGERHPITESKVVLTTAHLHDSAPENCAANNLKAMCQRCHLRLDIAIHKANALRTKTAEMRVGTVGDLFE